jgi:MFS family permease
MSLLWRNRSFLLLWTGQTLSLLGLQISGLALPLLVLALTGSAFQAGLIAAMGALLTVVIGLPAGALVDRWNRRMVMIICDLVRLLAIASVPLAWSTGYLTIAQLYAVLLIERAASIFFGNAEFSSLPHVVPAPQLPQALSLITITDSILSVLGPGLAGFIISLGRSMLDGLSLAYLVDSFSYLASVLTLGLIRIPLQADRPQTRNQSLWGDIANGLHFLWAERRLRVLAMLGLSLAVIGSPVYLALIVLVREQLDMDARTIGLIFSIAAIGGVVGSAISPWINNRLRVGQIIIGGLLLRALATGLLATATSSVVVVAGWALMSLLWPIEAIALVSYRLALVPEELRGRVNSAFQILEAGAVVGLSMGGMVMDAFGPAATLWITAAGLSVTAIIVSFTDIRQVRR